MAILKSVLEESLLSKSEQAAMRVLARVSMLNEGLIVLQKLSPSGNGSNPSAGVVTKISEFKKYLDQAIDNSLLQHRLPVNVSTIETKSQ